MHRLRVHAVIATLVAVSLGGCAAGASLGAGDVRNFHHAHTVLPTGKHKLVVDAIPGPGESGDLAARQADDFAADFARRTCPKGYDFFADEPLAPKSKQLGAQISFIFQCR